MKTCYPVHTQHPLPFRTVFPLPERRVRCKDAASIDIQANKFILAVVILINVGDYSKVYIAVGGNSKISYYVTIFYNISYSPVSMLYTLNMRFFTSIRYMCF